MRTRETFLRAKRSGTDVSAGEATVLLHGDPGSKYRTWVGLDREGRAVAYFELGDSSLKGAFSASRVILVEPATLSFDDDPTRLKVAKVACLEPRLDEVFLAFMDEVVENVKMDNPVEVLSLAVSAWRRLLQKAQSTLKLTALTGLYGELLFLENLVRVNGVSAINCWQRSGKDPQDFISSNCRVEIKTSRFQNRQAVNVNGLKQLELPREAALYLGVAEAEQDGGGERIDDVIERLLDLNLDRQRLVDKLADAHYVIGMPEGQEKFTLVSWRFWRIDEDCPVLNLSSVSQSVSMAISDVKYVLNLSALGESSSDFDFTKLSDLEQTESK
ncbi:PD-(D/E)XK motif protein [Flaviflexus ciconiae]|uniref:PD-(D/E)XK motif protein n=1 Tax=Flaviflexus ciconiae TaxID=2496867 RepID=A0A3Q9G7S8_9ACTO|nr:PD-(D/E)XK motif protein [Flaviflexus ciconiae]AZQ77091.1 PD-(D/E)XK motif protein [Flaviflexus ciconiae]